MAFTVTLLAEKHLLDLQTAVDAARLQWAPGIKEPKDVVAALDRVLLFLKQNGGAAAQSRQVASLAFVFGNELVRAGAWVWRSVSDDGSLNPAVVSPDGKHALLVVDVITQWVMGELKVSLRELFSACVEGRPHELLTPLPGE
jgi:hypothetical protein